MGGRCAVIAAIGLVASLAAADGKSIGEARRLMSSQLPGDRALAVQKLRSLDSREGLRILASGIRHALEDIERLGSSCSAGPATMRPPPPHRAEATPGARQVASLISDRHPLPPRRTA